MANNLLLQIEKFKDKDMTVFPSIFNQFGGLIKTYSRRIEGEDTFQELSVFLLELLYKINLSVLCDDDSIKRYICISLRNKYINLSKKQQNLLREQNEYFERDRVCLDPLANIILEQAVKVLTENQRKTVIYKYIYCYSDSEIARKLKITRQAVNRTKNRALNELKAYFEGE